MAWSGHRCIRHTPSKKDAPACSASWARLDALRALRPALGAAPSLDTGDLGVRRPPLLALGMDVVGISTFSVGFSCTQRHVHSPPGRSYTCLRYSHILLSRFMFRPSTVFMQAAACLKTGCDLQTLAAECILFKQVVSWSEFRFKTIDSICLPTTCDLHRLGAQLQAMQATPYAISSTFLALIVSALRLVEGVLSSMLLIRPFQPAAGLPASQEPVDPSSVISL